jgi:hypothetical protein
MTLRRAIQGTLVVLAMTAGLVGAQEASPPSSVVRQSLDDAWWTGPMLAPSGATLPRGHFLVEPYLYDVIAAHSNGFGSLTYVLYGLADHTRVTGYNILDPNSVRNPPSIRLDSGSSDGFGFAPAIEYSWKPNLGVLLGARVIPPSHNTTASITPVVAINFVH